jgi:hypothetical protein
MASIQVNAVIESPFLIFNLRQFLSPLVQRINKFIQIRRHVGTIQLPLANLFEQFNLNGLDISLLNLDENLWVRFGQSTQMFIFNQIYSNVLLVELFNDYFQCMLLILFV